MQSSQHYHGYHSRQEQDNNQRIHDAADKHGKQNCVKHHIFYSLCVCHQGYLLAFSPKIKIISPLLTKYHYYLYIFCNTVTTMYMYHFVSSENLVLNQDNTYFAFIYMYVYG